MCVWPTPPYDVFIARKNTRIVKHIYIYTKLRIWSISICMLTVLYTEQYHGTHTPHARKYSQTCAHKMANGKSCEPPPPPHFMNEPRLRSHYFNNPVKSRLWSHRARSIYTTASCEKYVRKYVPNVRHSNRIYIEGAATRVWADAGMNSARLMLSCGISRGVIIMLWRFVRLLAYNNVFDTSFVPGIDME